MACWSGKETCFYGWTDWAERVQRIIVFESKRNKIILLLVLGLIPRFVQGFLAERFFQNFDKTGSGSLSTRELIDGIKMLTKGSKLDKLRFLFQVYDVKGQS